MLSSGSAYGKLISSRVSSRDAESHMAGRPTPSLPVRRSVPSESLAGSSADHAKSASSLHRRCASSRPTARKYSGCDERELRTDQ